MPKPLCIDCGEEYNPKRKKYGFYTCLPCGSVRANQETKRKARCTAPAYNKGAYQYVGTKQAALGVGR